MVSDSYKNGLHVYDNEGYTSKQIMDDAKSYATHRNLMVTYTSSNGTTYNTGQLDKELLKDDTRREGFIKDFKEYLLRESYQNHNITVPPLDPNETNPDIIQNYNERKNIRDEKLLLADYALDTNAINKYITESPTLFSLESDKLSNNAYMMTKEKGLSYKVSDNDLDEVKNDNPWLNWDVLPKLLQEKAANKIVADGKNRIEELKEINYAIDHAGLEKILKGN